MHSYVGGFLLRRVILTRIIESPKLSSISPSYLSSFHEHGITSLAYEVKFDNQARKGPISKAESNIPLLLSTLGVVIHHHPLGFNQNLVQPLPTCSIFMFHYVFYFHALHIFSYFGLFLTHTHLTSLFIFYSSQNQ